LHTDPAFAAMGGFDTPILHGLCSYGFTARAILSSLCDNDPARFRHIEGRFASPVIPGDALTVRMWSTQSGESMFTTSAAPAGGGDERIVIDQGLVRHGK
jgi:acyl dehydratase